MSLESVGEDVERVPMLLAAMRSDTPAPARSFPLILLPLAVPALWFFPKRIGPSLAAAGWGQAILASFIGTTVGLGLIVYHMLATNARSFGFPNFMQFTIVPHLSEMTAWEMVRVPFVALIIAIHDSVAGANGLTGIYYFLGIFFAGMFVFTLLLVFFCAAGERLGLLVGRCLRLALWSTTLLIPLGIGFVLWPALQEVMGIPPVVTESVSIGATNPVDDPSYSPATTVLVLFGLWWLFVLLRAGSRYAGPAEGPAWEPVTSRCIRCNYIISGLNTSSNCPECNMPVTKSLELLKRRCKFTRWNALKKSVRHAIRRNEMV